MWGVKVVILVWDNTSLVSFLHHDRQSMAPQTTEKEVKEKVIKKLFA
jgi:hypothetical protein